VGKVFTTCVDGFEVIFGAWNTRYQMFVEDKAKKVPSDWERDDIETGRLLCTRTGGWRAKLEFKGQLSKVVKKLSLDMKDEALVLLAQEYGFLLPLSDQLVESDRFYKGGRLAIPLKIVRERIKNYLRAVWLLDRIKEYPGGLDHMVETVKDDERGDLFWLKLPDGMRGLSDPVTFSVRSENELHYLPWKVLLYLLNDGMRLNVAGQFAEWDKEKAVPVLAKSQTQLIPSLWSDLFRRVVNIEQKQCEDCGMNIYAERASKKRCPACRFKASDKKKREGGKRGQKK
jgi:predicted RNA-binding Zn-ribbon protein involved in translation (DUF1610 family)